LAVASTLVLQACGGGGESSETPPPIGNTPAPTPAPTPSPTPTPTPTGYVPANDFSKDRSFTAFGVAVTGALDEGLPNTDGSIDTPSPAVGFDFSAATRTYSVRYNSDTLTAQTTLVEEDPASPPLSADRFSDSRSLLVRSSGQDVFKYVGFLFWRTDTAAASNVPSTSIRKRRMVFGVRTEAGDIPKRGQSAYNGRITFPSIGQGTVDGFIGNSEVRLAIDWERGTMTGTAQVTYPFRPGIDFHFSNTVFDINGTVDRSTGRISASIPQGVYNGPQRIEGALFGPAAVELGLVILDTDVNGGPVAGAALATKQ